ncbi:MAG: ATP-binding protein [Muribaculaceae bacterium]|nr:ATP-binding protein [Muribaculaceae bacterium]
MSTYIPRALAHPILEASQYFPVITLTGPRQSGKSTLYRHIFPDCPYTSLEDPDTRLIAESDPRGFLSQFGNEMIIDEIQNYPTLLSYIQGIVDVDRSRRFYITGNSQFSLLKSVTQSLAGRSGVFELLPLSLSELENNNEIRTFSEDDILYRGFYPAIWSGENIPRLYYPSYVKTYLERDVRDLLNIKDLNTFHRFICLCAARIGSVFNASELSNELGVAVNTINSWLSVLQASYIIYLLPPFFTNTKRRLTKSPKLYFADTGLASYLLDIDTPKMMNRDKMRGHLFENMIVMECLKSFYNIGKETGLYFYRDSNGNEVDLLRKNGNRFDLIEVKSSQTFHPDFLKGIRSFERAFPDLVAEKHVVYAGADMAGISGTEINNFRSYLCSAKNRE